MYRLALDIGTNSIGWCLFSLDEALVPQSILRAGVRIFPDGREAKSGKSLAEDRRLARQDRRRRDRFIRRRNKLLQTLIAYGLMPESEAARKDLEGEDPYCLRARALDHKLTSPELGRALFHINQRRGFKSNRKTDNTANEKGVVKSGIKALHERLAMDSARSLGEYLHKQKQSGEPTRARPERERAKLEYPFYPERSLLEQEFDLIRNAQKQYHTQLTQEQWAELRSIIFTQRPLKEVLPGRCSLEPSLRRAPLALPLAQKVRILLDLNHLRILGPDMKEEKLTLAQRDTALKTLLTGNDLTFNALRKLTGLGAEYSFNLERSTQEKLMGDLSAKKLKDKKVLGSGWAALDSKAQNRLVELLLEEEDGKRLKALLTQELGLSDEQADKAAETNLPAGYASHSEKVLHKLARELEKGVFSYAEAREAAGYPYKDTTGEVLPYLPYYGVVLERYVGNTGDAGDALEKRYGRIANPTVHVALNQVRRVVNEIIKEYGLPAQVFLEVGRDLKNGLKAKQEIAQRQKDEKKRNDAWRAKLEENGIAISAESMLRMRLWTELAAGQATACCPYTGEVISFSRLFGDDIEIEHILPVARTLDNSPANKTLCLRRANRDKGNRSPYEAFHSMPGYNWAEILSRAATLPGNKKWRFAEDAMQRFEEKGGFLARQLTDTQYIARVAREYLCAVCPSNLVWVTPGRLTGLLRKVWGFPKKDRDTHYHHALDAALIGVADRSLLQRAATYSARAEGQGERRFLAGFAPPWPSFKNEVLEKITSIIVSHKADHGIEAALHNETAYGILAPNGAPRNAQHRKPVSSFTKLEHILAIKEIKLRAELLRDVTQKPLAECLEFLRRAEELQDKKAKAALLEFIDMTEKSFTEKFQCFAHKRGIRGIRIVETLTLVPICNKKGKEYKGLLSSSNAWYDIYENDKGKWIHDAVSTFDANNKRKNKEFIPEYAEKGFRHVMRLFKNDMVEQEIDGVKRYYYVLKIETKGPIYLVEHMQANVNKRHDDKNESDGFKLKAISAGPLQKMKAKAIFVTPAGRIIYKERPCHAAPPSGNKRK